MLLETLPHLMQALALQTASCNGKVNKGDSGAQVRREGNLETNRETGESCIQQQCDHIQAYCCLLTLGFRVDRKMLKDGDKSIS